MYSFINILLYTYSFKIVFTPQSSLTNISISYEYLMISRILTNPDLLYIYITFTNFT